MFSIYVLLKYPIPLVFDELRGKDLWENYHTQLDLGIKEY